MDRLSLPAKGYIGIVTAAGASLLVWSLFHWACADPLRFVCYLAIAVISSSLKVRLPEITGTMSVNFFFILIGIVELGLPETLLIGCAAVLTQCLWRPQVRPKNVQVVFSTASMANAVGVAYLVYHAVLMRPFHASKPLLLLCSASVFFVMNTLPISGAIAITEKKSLKTIWHECYFWSFPYYLAGAAVATVVTLINEYAGWQTSVMVLPIGYWIYRSYRQYLARLEDEKKHVEQMAALHLRTIEALALAIEAKDHTTHVHLRRVRVYAVELGKKLGLKHEELEALRAAALLHDIGKLGVPEHIISKPGKLTPEEFEKIKIHPIVGGEILERVQFPYPVVPIVLAHHEKWDGTGYPYGLKKKEIPVGARILAAVDCLDALASDRQYRRALPLSHAMAAVTAEAGKSFDPRVVRVLEQNYLELERQAQAQSSSEEPRLSTGVRVEREVAPATGFESTESVASMPVGRSFLSSIAAARQEAQTLFELSQELGKSLSLNETLSVLSVRLKRMIPYHSIAIYVRSDNTLIPEYVSGENFRVLSSLQIRVGQGLCGWVAQNRKAIVNGNPSVEPGFDSEFGNITTLNSALAVPLEGATDVVGVLALYHAEKDAFTRDHLRILLAISSQVALAIENALKYRIAEDTATTDYLTGLPNARSLFIHLDRELARAKRHGNSLTVLVCDLDGFKEVNDRFGHLEGNKLLQLLAEKLRSVCREYDYVARMGGDEFVLVFSDLEAEVARAKIADLQRIAAEAGRTVCGEDFLSMSIGQSAFPDDGSDAEKLLSVADRRMYSFKRPSRRAVRAAAPAAPEKASVQ